MQAGRLVNCLAGSWSVKFEILNWINYCSNNFSENNLSSSSILWLDIFVVQHHHEIISSWIVTSTQMLNNDTDNIFELLHFSLLCNYTLSVYGLIAV